MHLFLSKPENNYKPTTAKIKKMNINTINMFNNIGRALKNVFIITLRALIYEIVFNGLIILNYLRLEPDTLNF